MNRAARITYYFIFSLLLAACAAAAVCFNKPLLLGGAFAALAGLWLSTRPLTLFYVLVASLAWSAEYAVTASLSTDIPDEPLMLLMAFVAIGLMVYHRRELNWSILTTPLLVLLALQAGWWVVTALFSSHQLVSVKYLLAKGWYLLAFVGAPLLLLRTQERVVRAGAVLAAAMGAFVLLALARHGAAGFTFEAVNPSLEPFYRNHVNYSALLVCVIPIVAAFLPSTRSGRRKGLLIAALLVLVVALYFSYARGAWLALAVGAAAWWLLRKRWLVRAFVLAILLSLAAVWWLKTDNRYLRYAHDYQTTVFHTDFREHLVATYQLKDVSTAERFYRWIAGVRMVRHYWTTGTGPNTFYYHYQRYAVTAFKTWVSRNEERSTVHNYFLLTLIEQGIIGLVLLLLLLGCMFYTAQRIYHTTTDPIRKAIAGVVAVILSMICTVNFLSDLIETDKVGSVFYLCLAVLVLAARARPGLPYS